MAKLFQELKLHNKFPFEVEFWSWTGIQSGQPPCDRRKCQKIRYSGPYFLSLTSFDAVYTIEKSPCYLCARMRRGYLYSYAKELGCNKIALGHHYDDVIETILMGMLYAPRSRP